MGVFDLPTVSDVPMRSPGSSGGIFDLPSLNTNSKSEGGIFSTVSSGEVEKAVASLKTPAVNIPKDFDITKTESYIPTKDEITSKYGTSTTISQTPKQIISSPTGPGGLSGAITSRGSWGKIGDFLNSVIRTVFTNDVTKNDSLVHQNARNAIVQSTTDTVNNKPYVDIAKQLGIDQVVQPSLPKGVDPSKITPNILQYYKEQAAGNAVKNNWAVIQKTYPDIKLPTDATAQEVDKALGVDPSSALGNIETMTAILGTAALAIGTDGVGEIIGALAEGGLKSAAPMLINLGKNVALFTALDKITNPLREEIVKKGNIGDGGQALLYLAQQAANIMATHGASKGTDKIIDLFAKHTIEGFTLPQTVTLSGGDIQNILKTKGMTDAQFNQMAKDMGWGEDQKNAIKNGATITLPATKVITTADRPWWGKVKDFFGFEPSSETTVIKGDKGIEPSGGQIEGEVNLTRDDLMALAKKITTPTISTPPPGEEGGGFAKIAARLRSPEKVSLVPFQSSIPKGMESLAIEAKKYNTPTEFVKNNLHLLDDSSEIQAVRQGIKPIAIQTITGTNVSEAKGLNQFKANVNGTDMIVVYKNGQEANAHKLVDLFNGDRSGPEFHAEVGKFLGYTGAAIADFNAGKHDTATYNQTIDQLTDLYNKVHGLDINGKPIENTGYGKNNSTGENGNLREGSPGARNEAGGSVRRIQPGGRGDLVGASERLSGHAGENGAGDKHLARLGERLQSGQSTEINPEVLNILGEAGYSKNLIGKIDAAQKSGAVKQVSIKETHEGKKYVSAYKADTLFLNPNEIGHPSYEDGSIIDHELAGHSWYLKLDQSARQDFFNDLKDNKTAIRQAWEASDNSHINYWTRTVQNIEEKVRWKTNDQIAARIMQDFGLVPNGQISLDSFINESLNLDKTIGAINAELVRLGRESIDLQAHNTEAVQEHVAMLAEKSNEVLGNTELLKNYLLDVESGTLKYGPESTDKLAYAGEKDLTVKTLEKLKGRATVSKQFISDLTNAPDIKQTEKEVLRTVLDQYPTGAHIPVQQFADAVKAQLLPLKPTIAGSVKLGGERSAQYEGVTLREDTGERGSVMNYAERIYQSPIKTSAGETHFYNTGGKEPIRNYFGHSRIEDMADGTTRRVIEVQSDLFQKGKLKGEETMDKIRQFTPEESKLNQELIKKIDENPYSPEYWNWLKQIEELRNSKGTPGINKLRQYTNPTAHFRMVREEIKQAAKDGKMALQFPTGKTAMKIEGIGENSNFIVPESQSPDDLGVGIPLKPSDLEVGKYVSDGNRGWIITDVLPNGKFKAVLDEGNYKIVNNEVKQADYTDQGDEIDGPVQESEKETFDISGKIDTNNPIYRFYEKDLGRYLKNNYKAKPVTDAQGVTWYEVPIKPEMAKEPVTAFREKETDINRLRQMLDRETQSLNAAVANPEAHAMAYGENKVPIYQARIKDLKTRIAEAKNPTFDTGNALEDVRKTLEAAQKRTGVKPVVLPTMKVDGQDVPMPVDLYEKELTMAFKEEAIDENPLNTLWKYANKKEGTLPEVTGKGTSKFGREGDDIVSRDEFKQFADDTGAIDSEVIREKFAEFVEEKRQFRAELEDLKTERRQFIDNARVELAEKAAAERKARKLGFTILEYTEKSPLATISDLIGAEDIIRIHPGRQFMKYVNARTGILPEVDPEFPGVYGKEIKKLLDKKGITMEEAQKAVDNYIAHVDQLFLMTEDTFNPIEMVNSPSVFETNAFQTEKDRLAKDPNAKPLETMLELEDKYPLARKAGALDFVRTPDRVLKKMGLSDESELIKKKYNDYLKELPKNIQKITDWANRVPEKGSAQRIFDYLNGTPGPGGFVEPDFLTGEEKKVGDEMKDWLKEWATRLHLKPHERLDNYITHIFEEDFIKKEFDQDLAKIIQDKVPGEVYDPFLQQRLGALGYIHDVFRALDAYVKRATRKVHMDVALQKIKVAAQDLDVDSYTYVKQYIDRINLRPTKTDNYIDNSIKQMLALKVFGGNAYRLGARPTARITRAGRQLIYRGTLGVNIGLALKNISQGMNTFAILGPKYTTKGYMALLKGLNQIELTEENILGQDIIQDRTISSTKKFWEKFDSTLFHFFETAEKINRGAAYFGAKEKYYAENTRVDKLTGIRLWQQNTSEVKARAYAKRLVEQTQFTFGSVDTPLALGSDIMKTLLQFQSFNLKQAEFLAELAKNKNYAGMLRYLLAGVVILMTLGKLFKMKWQDLIPFSRYSLPPLLSAPLAIGQAALGTADKYGNVPSVSTREKNALFAITSFIPGGVQGSKTIRGLQSTSTGAPVGKKIESAIFGPDSNANSQKIMAGISKSAAAAHTKLLGLNSDIASAGQTTWDQVKKLGVGSEAADALVSNLSDDEYIAYGYAKAADSDYWVKVGKTVAPIVDKAAKAGFGSDQADALVSDLTDDQYTSYKNIKSSVYGTASTGSSKWDQQTFVTHVANLAKGWGTDPFTAFDDLIHGDWKITELKNGQIIVDRMPTSASEAIRKAAAKNNSKYTLDHIIPLEIGGTNRASNLQILSADDASNDDSVENFLGKALGQNRISGKKAQEYMIRFKAGQGQALSPDLMKEYTDKYGGKPMTFEDIQAAIK